MEAAQQEQTFPGMYGERRATVGVAGPGKSGAGGRSGALPFTNGVAARAVPPLWIGALALLQVALLGWVTEGRYLALTTTGNGSALLWAHGASQALVVVLLVVLAVAARRASFGAPLVESVASRRLLLAGQVGSFLLLTVFVRFLPDADFDRELLGSSEARAYGFAIACFSFFCLTTIALAASRTQRPGSAVAIFLGAWLAQAASNGQINGLLEGGRTLVEGTTLTLTLWFLDLARFSSPILSYDGATPVLSAPGFAITIAPSCSGYQGTASAVIVLGTYLALERHALHIRRALVACAAAIVAIFILNALRIAVLFVIGAELSPEVAVNGFHSQFGALSLLGISLLSILALEHPYFRQEPVASGRPRFPQAEVETALMLMLPLALYLLAGMVTGLFVGEFNWLYPLPVLIGALVIWQLRHRILQEHARSPRLLSVFVGVLAYVVWIAIIPPDANRAAILRDTLSGAPVWLAGLWILFRVAGASLVVPVIEELAFRGALMRLLENAFARVLSGRLSALLALALSSTAFGLMHSEVIAGLVAGLIFGSLYLWRRSLADAIVAHAVTNFLICLHVLGFGEWSYW